MAKWKVKNLVISADLKTNIPLEKLAIELPNADYNPEQFPGLILRFEKETPTMLVFNSGKVIVTGSKSVKEAREMIEKLRSVLKQMEIKTSGDYEIDVQNYVVSGHFEYDNIDLMNMVTELDFVQYDPEQFPGAIVRYPPDRGNTTFLVFRTGKFVCTGAKSDEEVEEVIKSFEKEIISKYAKA
ncbi:MAG TPA: TATA-box-binding protein [Candidatus Nanopusillus sp.]|nr:TATA-box-binding protein [Candidatus Nanopusillus sp.]